MRRSLCLFLAICILLFSLPFCAFAADTEPTEGPVSGLQGVSPVAVEANSAIASALIGAGVQPGTNLDDFNMLVSSCVSAMESEGMFTDGKIAFVSNNVDGVQYMYAPVHLIDAVRNWLLDDSGALIDNSVDSLPQVSFSYHSVNSTYLYEYTLQFYEGYSGYVYGINFSYDSESGVRYATGVFIRSSPYARYRSISSGTASDWVQLSSSGFGSNSYGTSKNSTWFRVYYDIPYFDIGHFESEAAGKEYAWSFSLPDGYLTFLDLYLSDLSSAGYSSWLGTSVDYDGATFVPCSVMNTYDDTIILPQEYVQGGITDYTPPSPPDVTVPDWESPDVPEYPGSESAPPDNELLWGIRVAVSETIPYWIKTTAGSIVEWLQRIYNHITDTVAGLVGVLSTQHDSLLAKLDELKAGFGGESSAGDELQSEVDRVDSELDEMTDIMNSVTRPDVDSIDTDISEHIDQANLTLLATPFTAMMTEGPFSTMVFITLTLVLCAYVLYGKR